jgi:hypothetical protein
MHIHSPKIRVYNVSPWFTPTLDRIPSVATGSIEDMRLPNNSESTHGSPAPRKLLSLKVIHAMAIADAKVPGKRRKQEGRKDGWMYV